MSDTYLKVNNHTALMNLVGTLNRLFGMILCTFLNSSLNKDEIATLKFELKSLLDL